MTNRLSNKPIRTSFAPEDYLTGIVGGEVVRVPASMFFGLASNYKGLAITTTNPGTPEAPEWWWASGPGTYTHFGGTVITLEIAILSYTGSEWISYQFAVEPESKRVTQMALAEAFTIASGVTYDADGIISAANIVWADGEAGTISNVTKDAFGINSIRYNRPAGKYATINITRDADGNVTATSVVLTGF